MQIPRTEVTLPPVCCGEGYLVSAPSYLVDRFVPACEIIRLPARRFGGGTGHYALGPGVAAPDTPGDDSRLRRLAARLRPPAPRPGPAGRVLVDLRRDTLTPKNWAHFLDDYIPTVFHLCARTGVAPGAVTLVLPAGTPGFILRAAALFGLDTLCTPLPLRGSVLSFGFETWNAIRAARADWARLPAIGAVLAPLRAPEGPPLRLFLSRRGTRVLSNEAEVAAFLAARGYRTVYAEDHSPAEQFRLFARAEAIVAIHGAALAPLLYRAPDAPLRQLVELFPPGHMTTVFRIVAEQVGIRWAGVRGRLRPEHIRPAYARGTPFTRHSLQAFHADPEALDLALRICAEGADAVCATPRPE
jgi:hypothetical protein